MIRVLYCWVVAWTMLGGKLFLRRSIRVSAVVTFFFLAGSWSSIFSMSPELPRSPGRMVTARTMPRMTANTVVDR